jgi:hypothetical protein
MILKVQFEILIQQFSSRKQHTSALNPKGDAKRSTASRSQHQKKKTLQKKRANFQKYVILYRWMGYLQTGQLRHNCPTTNLIGWHLQSTFRHVHEIQLGARRFRTYGCTELSRRRQTGALTSRNFHWNIALSAQDKAKWGYKSHNHGLINGRIYIYIYRYKIYKPIKIK